jgi:hypothetical protein
MRGDQESARAAMNWHGAGWHGTGWHGANWHCAECHASEDGATAVDAVCHHCGKPLCRRDQVLIPDEAFATLSAMADAVAVHCRSCRHEFHPGPYILLDWDKNHGYL